MASPKTIALDAMGGDHGPEVVIPGAALSLERQPALSFILYGNQPRIEAALAQHAALRAKSRVVHTDHVIAMDEKPSQALRRGKGSSMWLPLEAVKLGQADAAVSAGNTGALMAIAKLVLRPIAGIERPAIAAIWPTIKSECIVLDVGANIGATSGQLADFSLMGAAMARAVFHIERPSVGLLNVGTEEMKGNEDVKAAHALLKSVDALPLEYKGFVEGDQIGRGTVDVLVVEGFAGNIALKTAEGTAKQIGAYLRAAMTSSVLSKIGAFLAQGGFRVLKDKMDPRRVNGGTFLGLNGIAVKSHGGTDAFGFASAVDLAYEMADSGLIARLTADIDSFHHRLSAAGGGSQPQGATGTPLGKA
ncbi:phosphate acyltransferase PlsX [Hyphomicrobium sp. 99]|uniref:phosphate acyltransferase PlsX n=1 Tax=Hyphomicrobium sp. 99 TaxID=1163419 RepID=UPI0005F7F1D2|nr:phosphate acyltransferase PlsX [Hyphomicrobium sp. 99]